ncbi:MAG: glycosyltransferase [Myxococcaceae bacterium]
MNDGPVGRVDFHLHSYASNVTDYYAANAFAIPESYSDPFDLYRLLKARGMSLVTLTDHNSIDGVLQLLAAGHRDVFISAEMTTTFPEDGCNIHITIANVTEAQFREANRLRSNIYEMVGYLDDQIAREPERPGCNKIAYFMTHPLMSTQNRPYGREGALAIQHLEKTLLLCNTLEAHNGARTLALNELTLRMLRSLDRVKIERMANDHNLAPKGEAPWCKSVVGGSDDHSGVNPGRTWTRFALKGWPATPNQLVEAMRLGTTAPEGNHGGPITLAHSVLKLLYDGSAHKSAAEMQRSKGLSVSGPIHSLLRLVFDAKSEPIWSKALFSLRATYQSMALPRGPGMPFEKLLQIEVSALLADRAFRDELAAKTTADDRTFLVVSTLMNRVFARYVENLATLGSNNLVSAIKEAVAMIASSLFVSLPYLMSFMSQSSDGRISRDVRKAFSLEERAKLVLVTDTFFEINGVSSTIRRMLHEAQKRQLDFTVVTVLSAEEQAKYVASPEIQALLSAGRLKIFTSVKNVDFPEYDDWQLRFPPFLEMLKYFQEEGFTKMQISTPGLIGLTGLLAAKTLAIETAATYHTSVPEYVENYTRDKSLESLAWKYMLLFYHSVDEVLVPSKFIARLLHKRGLRNRKLLILDRWIDVDRFHPRKRTAGYWRKHGLENEEALLKFTYVGRVGVEKDLSLAAQAYRRLRETQPNAHLIIIGDGPYREELQRQLFGLPVTFTGFLQGDELARAIASADVKLFPSCTDTWGNAPLEAQASGLPVIVSDVGGPADLMRDGVTGIKFRARDANSLYDAMVSMMDEAQRARMGAAARVFAEENRVDQPFTAVLDSEAYRRRLEKSHRREPNDPAGFDVHILDLEGRWPDGDSAEPRA